MFTIHLNHHAASLLRDAVAALKNMADSADVEVSQVEVIFLISGNTPTGDVDLELLPIRHSIAAFVFLYKTHAYTVNLRDLHAYLSHGGADMADVDVSEVIFSISGNNLTGDVDRELLWIPFSISVTPGPLSFTVNLHGLLAELSHGGADDWVSLHGEDEDAYIDLATINYVSVHATDVEVKFSTLNEEVVYRTEVNVAAGFAYLMKDPAEPHILWKTLLHLLGSGKMVDNFMLGEGALPAATAKDKFVANFGSVAIGTPFFVVFMAEELDGRRRSRKREWEPTLREIERQEKNRKKLRRDEVDVFLQTRGGFVYLGTVRGVYEMVWRETFVAAVFLTLYAAKIQLIPVATYYETTAAGEFIVIDIDEVDWELFRTRVRLAVITEDTKVTPAGEYYRTLSCKGQAGPA